MFQFVFLFLCLFLYLFCAYFCPLINLHFFVYSCPSHAPIRRIVPEHGRTPEGEAFLSLKRGGDILTDPRMQQRECVFEDSSAWVGRLTDELTHLGSQLMPGGGGGMGSTLPIEGLLDELEDIASASASVSTPFVRGWGVETVRRMGVTYGVTGEYLLSLLDRWAAKAPEKHIHLLSSVTSALTDWRKVCVRQSSLHAVDIDQMHQAIRSGRLKLWLEKLRAHLGVLVGGGLQREVGRETLVLVEGEISAMKRYVDEMTIG